MNDWRQGNAGLAEYLIQDPARRVEVELEDRAVGSATWDKADMAVVLDFGDGARGLYADTCRGITRWRPRREPRVLIGLCTTFRHGDDIKVFVTMPPGVGRGVGFNYTLTEVL